MRAAPANEQVGTLTGAVQAATGESVELAHADSAYTGDDPDIEAASRGIHL